MKSHTTSPVPALLLGCAIGGAMWYGAFVALRATGLDDWQVLVFLGLLALAGLIWMTRQTRGK